MYALPIPAKRRGIKTNKNLRLFCKNDPKQPYLSPFFEDQFRQNIPPPSPSPPAPARKLQNHLNSAVKCSFSSLLLSNLSSQLSSSIFVPRCFQQTIPRTRKKRGFHAAIPIPLTKLPGRKISGSRYNRACDLPASFHFQPGRPARLPGELHPPVL